MTASGEYDLPVILRSEVDAYVKEETDVSLYTTAGGIFLGGGIAGVITLASGIPHPVPVYMALAVCAALTIAFGFLSVRERIQRKAAMARLDRSPFKLQLGWVPAQAPATGTAGSVDAERESKSKSAGAGPVVVPEPEDAGTRT